MADCRTIIVAGEDALAELDRLRDEFPKTGLWPILLCKPEERDGIIPTFHKYDLSTDGLVKVKQWRDPDEVAQTLAAAAEGRCGGDRPGWLVRGTGPGVRES